MADYLIAVQRPLACNDIRGASIFTLLKSVASCPPDTFFFLAPANVRLCIYILRDLILNRPGTLDGGFRDVMVGTFCEADFSSEEDLEDFFGLYRNHVLTMMRLIARLGPVPTLTFAGQALAQLHGSWAAAAGVTPAARKHLHLQWEAMSALFDSAMGGGGSRRSKPR